MTMHMVYGYIDRGQVKNQNGLRHRLHCSDVIMSVMAYQITGDSLVCSILCSGADQRKHQSSASLAFVREIHRSPVDSPLKGPVTRKMLSFDDIIMRYQTCDKPLLEPMLTCSQLYPVNGIKLKVESMQ